MSKDSCGGGLGRFCGETDVKMRKVFDVIGVRSRGWKEGGGRTSR